MKNVFEHIHLLQKTVQYMELVEVLEDKYREYSSPFELSTYQLAKLEEPNEFILEYLASLSPLNASKINIRNPILAIFEFMLPLPKYKILNMRSSTKEKIIKHTIHGLWKTLRKHRDDLLGPQFFFEDYHEENRLKILMDINPDPIILHEEHYKDLENIIMKNLEIALKQYLQIDLMEKDKSSESFYEKCRHLMFQIEFEWLQKYPYIDDSRKDYLSSYVIQKLEHGLLPNAIKNYSSLLFCPLSYHVNKIIREVETSKPSVEQVQMATLFIRNLSILSETMSETNLTSALCSVVFLLQKLLMDMEKYQDKDAYFHESEIKIFYDFLKELNSKSYEKRSI